MHTVIYTADERKKKNLVLLILKIEETSHFSH